ACQMFRLPGRRIRAADSFRESLEFAYMKVENISPALGAVIHVDRSQLLDEAVAKQCVDLLDERGVLVFPRFGLTDEEQLAFTDRLGARVNFTSRVPGGDRAMQDVYTITLDPKV